MICFMRSCHIPEVAAIEQICFSDPWSARLLEDSLQNSWNHFWVAEEDTLGTVLGYAALSLIAGEGEIQRIAVLPVARRQGTARELMAAMERFVRENQGEALTLEVRQGNRAARNLYKSCGFAEEAIRKGYYRHPAEDAVIMWKREI